MWRISRVCEAFHCRPTEAMEELERAPIGVIDSILMLRGYAAIYQEYKAACARGDESVGTDPRFDLVIEHEFALLKQFGGLKTTT